MCLLRQSRNAFSGCFCFRGAERRIVTMMLVHLFLMLMEIEFVHARACANLECFNVTRLIFHEASVLCTANLSLPDCLTLKRARSYSQPNDKLKFVEQLPA